MIIENYQELVTLDVRYHSWMNQSSDNTSSVATYSRTENTDSLFRLLVTLNSDSSYFFRNK